jgi:hypothetical protein
VGRKTKISNTAPPVSGLTEGQVMVFAGPNGKYGRQENLSLVGAINDRFNVR